ncbi:MAG: hypothetical protein AAF570_06995, partial [Bacteroidota bacterium]
MSVITADIYNVTRSKSMNIRFELMYIDTCKEVNRIPMAELMLLDGNAARQEFIISDDGFFDPGMEIRIGLRHDDKPNDVIFKGIVLKQSLRSNKEGSYICIELVDKAFAMTLERKSAVFR